MLYPLSYEGGGPEGLGHDSDPAALLARRLWRLDSRRRQAPAAPGRAPAPTSAAVLPFQ